MNDYRQAADTMKPEVEAAVARLEDRLTLIESRQLEIPEWHAMELPIARDARTLITALAEAERDAARLADARKVVDEQAEEPGIWFDARYVTESYLQQELRKLHAAIEGTHHDH